MNRKSQELKTLLLRIINTQKQDLTGLVSNPDVDFSRNRKIPYEKMMLIMDIDFWLLMERIFKYQLT